MGLQVVVVNGREYVRIPTKFITVKGRRVYASTHGKECFFINIPIEKFDPNRYKG